MSVLFTDTMTVYNYRLNPATGAETWLRSIIKGVQWRHNKDEFSISGKAENASKVESITIDFMRQHGNKPYLPPQEYKNLTDGAAESCWTLAKGKDIVVFGVSDIEINSSRDIKALKENFQYVHTVTAVSDNRSRPRLKHIKVVAK